MKLLENEIKLSEKNIRTLRQNAHEFYPVETIFNNSLPAKVIIYADKNTNLTIKLYEKDYYMDKLDTHFCPYDFINIINENEMKMER